MTKDKAASFHCTLEATLAVISGKYKSLIIWHLNDSGTMRFSELQKALPQATAKMLSQQLHDMVEDGIISRTLYPVVPPKTEYALTELGRTIVPIILALCDWGEAYFKRLGIPSPDACAAESARKLKVKD